MVRVFLAATLVAACGPSLWAQLTAEANDNLTKYPTLASVDKIRALIG